MRRPRIQRGGWTEGAGRSFQHPTLPLPAFRSCSTGTLVLSSPKTSRRNVAPLFTLYFFDRTQTRMISHLRLSSAYYPLVSNWSVAVVMWSRSFNFRHESLVTSRALFLLSSGKLFGLFCCRRVWRELRFYLLLPSCETSFDGAEQ